MTTAGGGIYGHDARIIYRAPRTGTYYLLVRDANNVRSGAYVLTFNEAPADAVPVSMPSPPEIVESELGAIIRYESQSHPFSILYPAAWTETPVRPEVAKLYSTSDTGHMLMIAEEPFSKMGVATMTLDQYVDVILNVVRNSGGEVVSRTQVETVHDIPAVTLEITLLGGTQKAKRFIYVHEGKVAFNATYVALGGSFEDIASLVDESFGSFRIDTETGER